MSLTLPSRTSAGPSLSAASGAASTAASASAMGTLLRESTLPIASAPPGASQALPQYQVHSAATSLNPNLPHPTLRHPARDTGWWPGVLLPFIIWLLADHIRAHHGFLPDTSELLLMAVVLSAIVNTRSGFAATLVANGLYAYRLWPYLETHARIPALWQLGWCAAGTLLAFVAIEGMRWRGRSATRAGSQLRRELLDAFQKHERSAAEMACVLEQVAEGILICDPEGIVTFANAEARRLYGAPLDTPAHLLGRDCRFVTLDGDALPRTQLPLARAMKGEAVADLEWRLRRADGSEIVVLGGAAPVRDNDGTRLGVVATLRDMSVYHRAVTELENANRVKTEFLGVLSHELRTPLTPILGWVTLLRGSNAALLNDPGSMADALEAIERNALAQKRLIDDLIDAISLLSGEMKLSLSPALLPHTLRTCVSGIESNAALRGITFNIECDANLPPLLLDEPRFAQALRHVLSNAVKFSHDNGVITLRACYRPEMGLKTPRDGVVMIDILDNGEGIEPETLPYIFEMFRQGDGSATRRHGGLGVGLTVARALIEMHGGDIAAHSEGVGKGACFTIALPVPDGGAEE